MTKKKKEEEEEEDKKREEKKRKEKKIARPLFWHFARIFFSTRSARQISFFALLF